MDSRSARPWLKALGITIWQRREPGAADHAPESRADANGWGRLKEEVQSCVRCGLHAGRTQTVFGIGPRNATWCFVGEAPGAEEDRRGEPFVGRAGQLLDAMLRALGLDRGQVFIANVLKCRPPGNRDPQPSEVAACLPYLRTQIATVRPRVVVALGRFAAQSLLATDQPLGRLRGPLHDYEGIPVVVTYHPAYLLRRPADKAAAWVDLKRAREIVTNE
ncbi:uracil-DNA glycosylase [Acidiferrobacter sp.]|jgi:DNA polymerase|uniref:uracil-DNA glycosylase n=1 Tax=Acidiferrobacter sp. TaxID=1872107 RepID=UPI002611D6D2|nr:uracil-DNA glycosylase [Acidiferrobacter sp.]